MEILVARDLSSTLPLRASLPPLVHQPLAIGRCRSEPGTGLPFFVSLRAQYVPAGGDPASARLAAAAALPQRGRETAYRAAGSGFLTPDMGKRVLTSDERTEDARRVQYFFFMQVIEVETGAIRWQHKAYATKMLR